MQSVETAIRLIIIGQELLIALVFLVGRGNMMTRVSGALLLTSVAAYLYASSPELSSSVAVVLPVVTLLSVFLPYFLWTFARCVFDSPWPPRWVISLFVAFGLVVWIVFRFEDQVPDAWFDATFTLSRIVSLVIVVNTLWLSAIGRRDDLLERRRRFRPIFVTLISLQAIAVLIVELVLGTSEPEGWLSMVNVILIGAMTMGLAVFLLRLSEDFFAVMPEPQEKDFRDKETSLNAAERVLYEKLMSSMDSGTYRQTGLTISALADDLTYPEHQLRRLINQHLGFRNFSAFLNSYRIGEATRHLGDPEQARTPVLTIALDLGYGSLGPFNRAFKEMTGMTPTEFREQAIPANSE